MNKSVRMNNSVKIYQIMIDQLASMLVCDDHDELLEFYDNCQGLLEDLMIARENEVEKEMEKFSKWQEFREE